MEKKHQQKRTTSVSGCGCMCAGSCLVGVVVPNFKLLDGQCIVYAPELVDERTQRFHPFLSFSGNRGNLCQSVVCDHQTMEKCQGPNNKRAYCSVLRRRAFLVTASFCCVSSRDSLSSRTRSLR